MRHMEVAGRPPDAVVYASVLWDLQRWSTEIPDAMQGRQLPRKVLDEWSGHFTALLRYIKVCCKLDSCCMHSLHKIKPCRRYACTQADWLCSKGCYLILRYIVL